MFRCPSDDNSSKMESAKFTSGTTSYYYWDFYDSVTPSAVNHCKKVSYSIQAPLYTAATTSYSAGFTASSSGNLVIMADKTPATTTGTLATLSSWAGISEANRVLNMSQNHNKGDFINALYADVHVGTGSKRADIGISNDNIYSESNLTTGGSQTVVTTTVPPTAHLSGDDSFLIGPRPS